MSCDQSAVFRTALLLISALYLMMPTAAAAASYPSRPVTIIVPTAPGGGVDVAARLIAAQLQKRLGQAFIIENRGGASGNIGTLQAARAPHDGYTLLLGNSGYQVTNPGLFPDLQWDPVRDFSGVAMIMRAAQVIVVNKNFSASTLSEFIAYARAHPGKINYATPGAGTQNRIAAELLAHLANIKMTQITYRGAAPAINDLLAGAVDMFISATGSLIGVLQSKAVKALAIASPKRLPLLPDIPTTAEAGVPNFEVSTWYALYAPAGTPRRFREALARQVKECLRDDEFKSKVAQNGATVEYMSPAQLDDYTAQQVTYWTGIIHELGITIQ